MRPRLAALAACAALIAAAPSLGNIIGPTDDRGTLGELGPGLGMSAADIERFRGATGFVVCSGSVHDNETLASGTLVGDSDILVTAAHVLVDFQGRARMPLAECYFQPQGSPDLRYPFATGINDIYLGLNGLRRPGTSGDVAVIRLTSAVADADPFPAQRISTAAVLNTQIVAVSAGQSDWQIEPVAETATDAIIRPCVIRQVMQGERYMTDCDMRPVGSGGAIFTHGEEGWVPIGVVSSTGRAILDMRPFNPSFASSTVAVVMGRELMAAIEAMRAREPLPASNRYLPCPERPPGDLAACAD